MRLVFRCLFVALTLFPLTALAAPPEMNLKEGAWSITVQAPQVEPDPAAAPAAKSEPPAALPTVQPFCISRKDPVPQPTKNSQCTLISKDVQGDTVFWVMDCRDEQGTHRTVGNATYSGKKVEGSMQVTSKKEGTSPLVVTLQLSGRYVGSCR